MGEVGLAGGIIRARYVPFSAAQDDGIAVYGDKGSRKGGSRIVRNVAPGGIPRNRALGVDRRIDGANVRFYGGVLGVVRIPRKGQETDGRENREHRYDHDEFHEGESADFPKFFQCFHAFARIKKLTQS